MSTAGIVLLLANATISRPATRSIGLRQFHCCELQVIAIMEDHGWVRVENGSVRLSPTAEEKLRGDQERLREARGSRR